MEKEIREVIGTLELAKQKLNLYRDGHSGEYIGGAEFTHLIEKINNAQMLMSRLDAVVRQGVPQPVQTAGNIKDKNGEIIKVGDTIYNEHDEKKYYKVAQNENGELCFADDMTVIDKRFATEKFWQIVYK